MIWKFSLAFQFFGGISIISFRTVGHNYTLQPCKLGFFFVGRSLNYKYNAFLFSSVQLLSHVQLFATPWTAPHQESLSITNSQSLLKLLNTELVMRFNNLILCRPLFLLTSIFPSIRVLSNELFLYIRWPKYWSFSFSISPSNEYSGLISSSMDWLHLLAVQGTLKSLLQHHSSKTSVPQHSAFLIVCHIHL